MPRGLGGVPQVIVGALGRVPFHHPGLREAPYRFARLGYGGTERVRELVRGLRRMRRMADVARKQSRFSPCRLDRAIPPEAQVEPDDREDEKKNEKAEEGECRAGIDRPHRGHHAVAVKGTGAVVFVELIFGAVQPIDSVRIRVGVAARGTDVRP